MDIYDRIILEDMLGINGENAASLSDGEILDMAASSLTYTEQEFEGLKSGIESMHRVYDLPAGVSNQTAFELYQKLSEFESGSKGSIRTERADGSTYNTRYQKADEDYPDIIEADLDDIDSDYGEFSGGSVGYSFVFIYSG